MGLEFGGTHWEVEDMETNSTDAANDHPDVLFTWSARKIQPIVLLYVAAVFVATMALAYFVAHSMTAVKALAMTAVVAIVPLVPTVLMRVEYRLTERTIDRRPVDKEKPKNFEEVVRLDQLSHIVPVKHGFKFYKHLEEPSPLRRFWKLHVSDQYSGEVHMELADQERVLEALSQQGIRSR